MGVVTVGATPWIGGSVAAVDMGVSAPLSYWPSGDQPESNSPPPIAAPAAQSDASEVSRDAASAQGTPDQDFLLLIEDNRGDVYLILWALEIQRVPLRVEVIGDGQEAQEYFERLDANPTLPCPRMVLVDLNLPKKSGHEVLDWLRTSIRSRGIPAVVCTTSNADVDREQAQRLGATHYFHKTSSYREFLKIGEVVKEVLNMKTESNGA
jgi:CheY-like chemotaxis protein